jgi:hypothetical protein
MLPFRGTLRLYDSFDGEIILIPSWQWHSLRREGGYQEAEQWRAVWGLNRLSDFDLTKARVFVADAELRCPDRLYALPQMGDHEVRSTIIRAMEEHRIIAIRRDAGPTRRPQGKGSSVELRRLIEQVEKAGRLSFQGRQYKLVVADDLGRLPSRDRYEVVPQADARAVLEGLARESPSHADGLRQASDKMSNDWRHTSHPEPEGLVLLRWVSAPVFASKTDDAPAITPSQMKAQSQKDWIEIEVFDQDDEPYPAHYRLEPADSDVREGNLGEDGFVNVSAVEPGTCKLTLGDVTVASDADQTSG